MNHLRRELAPISEAAWDAIDTEARTKLTTFLAARKLVDFEGPRGWQHSATSLGRVIAVDQPMAGVEARLRQVLPLVELRVPFTLRRDELDAVDRGALDLDLDELDAAVTTVALAENRAVFHGFAAGGVAGITEATSRKPVTRQALTLPADVEAYPTAVAVAVNALLEAGVGGPYGLAIGPEGYTRIVETTEHGGYLLLDHLRHLLGGPVVWAPGVDGAIVLSLRGGDFVFDSGQDLSIGYLDHTVDTVTLYLEESFSFRVVEPNAAVALPASA